jgi:hypothetical protein
MKRFSITHIPDYKYEALEQLGTKSKFWFTDDKIGLKRLFKIGRDNTGENWVEVISAELCELLNIPHAEYEFATWSEKEGTISTNFVPETYRLIHGNELLAKVHEKLSFNEYPVEAKYKVREYQLKLIILLMKNKSILMPLNYKNDNLDTAFDVFISYIMFDCLISNSDRHHENWGWIIYENKIYLSPTYDHASGLGCRESDLKKQERLTSNDTRFQVQGFVKKAKTPFYNRTKNLKTIDAFKLCAEANRDAAIYWLEQLEQLNLVTVKEIFKKIPTHLISDVSIDFAMAILEENKKRLLKVKEELQKND